MRSSPRIGSSRGHRGPDRCSFLGNIDPDRTPGDTAAATDATGGAELVDPVGQLVRHPLAVARARRAAHTAAVDVGKIQCETGIPATHPLGGGAGQIGGVASGSAETGRTDIRAVAAGQATLGSVVPARMIGVALKQFLESLGLETASHLTPGAGDNPF